MSRWRTAVPIQICTSGGVPLLVHPNQLCPILCLPLGLTTCYGVIRAIIATRAKPS